MTPYLAGKHRLSGLAFLSVALALLQIPALAQNLRDDFGTYAAGSDGTPIWEPGSEGWEMANGTYLAGDGSSVWRASPLAAGMTFACEVTVLELGQGDWLTAGIGIAADDRNYWALNLVAAPEGQQRRHSTEMQEMLQGVLACTVAN